MKVIFMGTPDFAVPALKQLIDSSHEVIAVYTQPPRPAGRGKKDQKSPIHLLAEQNGIMVKTYDSLKDKSVQEEFASMDADVAAVAAYGLLLPEAILKGTKHGCLNIHPSLLPRWRGAAPIQHTILAGDKETAACIMQMDKGLDTGDVLMMEKYQITPRMTAGQLHDVMAEKGAELLVQAIDKLANGSINPQKQSTHGVTYAYKITREDERIDWNKTAEEIDRQIRALNPRPGAYFEHGGERIKIFEADFDMAAHDRKPGDIDRNLTIACGKGMIRPLKLQRPGKTIMDVQDFLRGFKIS